MLLISLWEKRQSNDPDTIFSMMLPSVFRLPSLILSELTGKGGAVSTAYGAVAHLAPGRGVEVDPRVTSIDAAASVMPMRMFRWKEGTIKMPQCRLVLAKISTLQQEGAR